MTDKREAAQKPEIRSTPGDIYKMATRGAEAVQKWSNSRKPKAKRATGGRRGYWIGFVKGITPQNLESMGVRSAQRPFFPFWNWNGVRVWRGV